MRLPVDPGIGKTRPWYNWKTSNDSSWKNTMIPFRWHIPRVTCSSRVWYQKYSGAFLFEYTMYAALHYLKCALNLLSFQIREAEQTVTVMFSTGIIFWSYRVYRMINPITLQIWSPLRTLQHLQLGDKKMRENGDTTINIKIIPEIFNEIPLSKWDDWLPHLFLTS